MLHRDKNKTVSLQQNLQFSKKGRDNIYSEVVKKGKAIPETGREGPQGCETSRLPHFV
jgi:hypothetical protein